jgi:hypothetical protein
MPAVLRIGGRRHATSSPVRPVGAVMSLPAGQQRSLDLIASTLLDDDLVLASLFGIFTQLACGEAMPSTERVIAGPWRRRLRSALVGAAGLDGR